MNATEGAYHAERGDIRASLIVIVWNGKAFLSACLDSILSECTADDEVIVVDNGSTDGSADYVSQHYPQIRQLRLQGNFGYAGGANRALSVARGRYLFLLNQDMVLEPGWLEAMLNAFRQYGDTVLGCKALTTDERVLHAGGRIAWPLGLPSHRGHLEADDGRWDAMEDVDYVNGAAWGFSRTVLERVGWLDEGFWPGYYEDVDFCFRARDLGVRVLYNPEAVVVHRESMSLGKGSSAYLQAFHQGRLRFVLKRLPSSEVRTHFVPAERLWFENQRLPVQRVLAKIYRRGLLIASDLYGSVRAGEIGPDEFQCVVQQLMAMARHAQEKVNEYEY